MCILCCLAAQPLLCTGYSKNERPFIYSFQFGCLNEQEFLHEIQRRVNRELQALHINISYIHDPSSNI